MLGGLRPFRRARITHVYSSVGGFRRCATQHQAPGKLVAMNLTRALTHLQATRCKHCNGHGFTNGLFHKLDCLPCGGVGFVQVCGHRRLDRLAVGVIARARSAQAAQAAANVSRDNVGTPDNWILKNNYRGD